MRKVTEEMMSAIKGRRQWSGSDTTIMVLEDDSLAVLIYTSLIAEVAADQKSARLTFDGRVNTITTNRLNVIARMFGYRIGRKKGEGVVTRPDGTTYPVGSKEWFVVGDN